MASFTVGVRDPESNFSLKRYEIKREGNQISINEPDDGTRRWKDGFTLSLGADQIDLKGAEREWRIKMAATGVTVDNPRDDGMRFGGCDLELTIPLRPEQYQSTGLAVASTLIGIPLPLQLLES